MMEQQAEKKTIDIEKEEGLTMVKAEEYGRGCCVVLQKPYQDTSKAFNERTYINLCTTNNISFYKGSVMSKVREDDMIKYTL